MRQSRMMGRTVKDTPRDAQAPSHRHMIRAGWIRPAAAGAYTVMPLLWRAIRQMARLVEDGLAGLGAEEMQLAALQPRQWWDAAGGRGALTVTEVRGPELVLAGSFEPAALEALGGTISSYKHLPRLIFQSRTVVGDEGRPRGGLLRPREALVVDVFAAAADGEELERMLAPVDGVFREVLERLGVEAMPAEAAPHWSGRAWDLAAEAAAGDDRFLTCRECGYVAAADWAASRLDPLPQDTDPRPLEAVYGPGMIGVGPLAEFLGLPVGQTTKTLLFQAGDELVAVMVRGDADVNEPRVRERLGIGSMALAPAEAIRELTGAEVGYAGPIGLPETVRVLADRDTDGRVNFECGANRTDYHYINANYGRDFPVPEFGDYKQAAAGHRCPHCDQGRLEALNGVALGRREMLGSGLAQRLGMTFLGPDGRPRPLYAAGLRLNITRLAGLVVERGLSDDGLAWPTAAAPYLAHLIGLNLEKENVGDCAERVYAALRAAGIPVLFDDRDARAGEKFGDADLFGLPVRLTVSRKTVEQGGVELKIRASSETRLIAEAEVVETVRGLTTGA